jgi:Xaa-Pro aminopeptidase
MGWWTTTGGSPVTANRQWNDWSRSWRGWDWADATVGFEQNFISAADWQSLATTLPRMWMRDSTAVMDDVRAVKTPGEIALFRRSADLLDQAYLKHFPTVRPGMMERELHAALVAECLANGCHFVHGIQSVAKLSGMGLAVPFSSEISADRSQENPDLFGNECEERFWRSFNGPERAARIT